MGSCPTLHPFLFFSLQIPEESALLPLVFPLLEVSATGVLTGLIGHAVPRLRLGEADSLHPSLREVLFFLPTLIVLLFLHSDSSISFPCSL